jgi:hypothetical protein
MRRYFHCLFVLLVGFAAVCLLPPAAKADVTAAVLGTVADSAGRIVPNASVRLSNPATGYDRSVATDSNGNYEFLSVPVGDGYELEVSSPAFAKSLKQGVTLQVNQRFRADFVLTVGQVTEQVTVAADSVQVDTTTNQLGDLITDEKMIALPLNGRSYTDLMGLQPGVVPITSSAAFTDRPVSGELNAGGVSVNGSQESGNSFLINGGDVEEPKNSGASVIPTLDSIQEFRILTNTFDAEYGRFGGAIVNVVTKTGTNDFHGSAYEFLRNEDLNAKNFFDQNQVDPATQLPIPNTARGVFKRNQFGFTFGGPIVKNRVFFFSDYQGTREVRGQTASVAFVPSVPETTGDFSDAATTGFGTLTGTVQGDPTPGEHTMPETLTARLGYTVTSGEPYWFAGCASTADCVFPGQKIPQAAWDPAAAGTLKFIPAPTGLRGTTPFYSTSSLATRLNDDKIGERVTWSDPRTGDWSFYFTYDNASSSNPFAGGNVPNFPGTVPQKAWQGNASNTHVFSASMVNELRLNYTRSTIFQTHPEGPGLGPLSSFGFSTGPLGLISSVPSVEGVPSINIGGGYGVSMGVVAYAINQVNNEYQLVDFFSKVIGKHSLKFGGEARQIQVSEYNISTPNGNFAFNGTETGNGFADYLLGAPNSFAQQSYSTFFTRANYGGLFIQDSFRARPNLTINAGLRYELIQPFYEIQNRLNAIVWGLQSTVYPGAPTGWVFPGDAGLPNTISKTPHDNFSPRLGFNWSPPAAEGLLGKLTGGPGKTSIRAGTGIYYTAIEDQPAFYTIGDAPFGLYYQSPTQVYFNSPYEDRRHGNDPGQHFPFIPPTPGSPVDWSKYLPIGGSPGVDPNNTTPYVIQFNLNIQRELPGAAIMSAGYVGTRGHHLLAQVESNPGIASRCLQIAAELPTGQGCGPYGEDQIYALPDGGSADGTRIHSVTSGRFLSQGLLDFSSNAYNTTIVNSDYNALQLSLAKHIGFSQFLASYTWSKSIDNGSGDTDAINPFYPRRSRALSAFDLGHNFVVSYGLELPKLQGQRALVRKPLGGWELTGITRFTTGLPVTISENVDQSLSGLSDTPNWDGQTIAKSNPRSSSARTYFNSDQFSLQALGTFGSSSRRFFHGPGLDNWDMALRKSTQINDRYALEFRAEFFNVFNHTQFNNPDGNQSAADFGEVSTARDPRIGQVALRFTF